MGLEAIPGPRGLELLRHLLHFQRDSLEALEVARERYGPVVAFGGPVNTVLVFRPADARRLLLERSAQYEKGAQTRELTVLLGEGLVTARSSPAASVRREQVRRALGIQAIRALAPRLARRIDVELAALREGPIELYAAMRRLAFALSTEVLLGERMKAEDAQAIDEAVRFASHLVHRHMFSAWPLPYWVPTPSHVRFHAHRRRLDGALRALAAEARRTASSDSVLAVLARSEGFEDERALRDEVVTLLVAGYETTACALTFVLGTLAAQPELRREVEAELDRAGIGEDPTLFARTHPLLHRVVLESLRLHPPIAMTSLRALEADVIGGHPIAAGTNVVLPLWVIHRDPESWGPDAARFDAARFARGVASSEAYLPFSKGERSCVGQVLAMAEIAAVLTRLLTRFRVEASAPMPRAISEVSLRPSGPARAHLGSRA